MGVARHEAPAAGRPVVQEHDELEEALTGSAG